MDTSRGAHLVLGAHRHTLLKGRTLHSRIAVTAKFNGSHLFTPHDGAVTKARANLVADLPSRKREIHKSQQHEQQQCNARSVLCERVNSVLYERRID